MPVSLSFTEPSTFMLNATGHVTYAECHAALQELISHPRLADSARILADGRTVTGVPSTDELRALAVALHPLADRGVHSLGIVTSTGFVYGVARMFSVFAELADVSVPVFRDAGEAERWLSGDATREPS